MLLSAVFFLDISLILVQVDGNCVLIRLVDVDCMKISLEQGFLLFGEHSKVVVNIYSSYWSSSHFVPT